jgi:hypothetical protein
MCSQLSFLPSRKSQSINGNNLQYPPEPRQRSHFVDPLTRKKATLGWLHAKTELPRFKYHPPHRRPAAIHMRVLDIPSPSK